MAKEYIPLEKAFTESVSGKAPSYDITSGSFFTSASFLYAFFFVIIVVAASSRYAYAGILRMQASQEGISKSKEEFKRVTYGLLGVFGLWLILFTVNKDLLTGDVGLGALKTKGGVISGGGGEFAGGGATGEWLDDTPVDSGSGSSRACGDVATVKTAALSSAGVCGNTACTILSGCKYNEYLDIIKTESVKFGVDYKMIVVTMCKESAGNPEARNQNPDGSYDCGIMQINQKNSCDTASALRANVGANIARGVEIMKEKINSSSASRVYPNIPAQAGIFASYNCCSNGTVPNNPSESCKTSEGWPSLPKWACPIDPGTAKFNMCGVKSYACELTACLSQVR